MMKNNVSGLQGSVEKRSAKWVFIYILLVLASFYPYEFYSMYFRFLPDQTLYTIVFFFAVTVLLMAFSMKKLTFPSGISLVFIMQMIGYLISNYIHGTIKSVPDPILKMVMAILLIVFINNTSGMVAFYKKYNRWIMIMAMLGTIVFFLVTFLNVKPLYFVVDRADGRLIYNYFITFTKTDFSSGDTFRYAGFFDEPGAMAYWGLFALIINKLFIKNRKFEIVVIVCLLFTFSLGFYVQLIAYLLLFYVNRKNLGQSLLLFVIIAGSMWFISSRSGELYDDSIGRLISAIDQSQQSGSIMAVDSRVYLVEEAKREFWANPWFGTPRIDLAVGNNVYETLALYGIVGSFFILFPFLLLIIWGIRDKNIDLLKSAIVLILGFTHRPFHTNLLSFFIVYSIFVMYRQSQSRPRNI